MIVLAIDIGLTGALAAVDSYGTARVQDLPTLPDGKTQRLDGRGLYLAMRAFVPPGEHAALVFEDVRARPLGNGGSHGNTMHSQAALFGVRRAVEAVCDIARIEVCSAQPATWKRKFGLIRMVRDTWRRDSEVSERKILRLLCDELDLLVIDEIGAQYGTDGEQNLIFEVMDRRYSGMRPTILLTNQDKEGFKSFVGDRVFDRLRETSRWVAFDWPSYRPTARGQA